MLDGVILKGMQVVIPPSIRQEILQLIHEDHMSITNCQLRARSFVFWLKLNTEIERIVMGCLKCQHDQLSKPQVKPLMP